MKGRGLLIAAAVIQLIGASFGLLSAFSSLVMMPAIMQSLPDAKAGQMAGSMMRFVGIVELLFVGLTIWVSIKLIQRRRWAWIVSLVMACVGCAVVLLGSAGALLARATAHHQSMGIGFGEIIIVMILGAPVFVVIGLLIGGRSAIAGAADPRA